MAVQVNVAKCDGCKGAKEPVCVYICPGDLFIKEKDEKVKLRDIRDCWDCAACVKSCPKQAVEMYLPIQMGGKGAVLTARTRGKEINWECTWPNGEEKKFKIKVST